MNVVGIFSNKNGERRTLLVKSFVEGCYNKGNSVELINVDDIYNLYKLKYADILVSYGCRNEIVNILELFNDIPRIRIYDPPIRPLGKLNRELDDYYGVTWDDFHKGYVYDENLNNKRWINLKYKYNLQVKPWSEGSNILLVYQPNDDFYGNSRLEIYKYLAFKCLETKRRVFICNRPKCRKFKFKGCYQCVGLENNMYNLHCIVSCAGTSVSKGIINGIPSFSYEGNITTPLMKNITIDEFLSNNPKPNRQPWLNWVAYQQWTIDEMREGLSFEYMVDIKNEI